MTQNLLFTNSNRLKQLDRTSATLIQAKCRTFLAQDKLLVLWENSFYDMMAITIQTKIKQYLAQVEFESRVLLAEKAEDGYGGY